MLIEATWQEKSEKNRSKDAGYWCCPACKCRLAALQFNTFKKSRMCGEPILLAALVMRADFDQRGPGANHGEVRQGAVFARTERHAARSTIGREDYFKFGALRDEGLSRGQLNSHRWAVEKMKEIRIGKGASQPTLVEEKHLPVCAICPGCGARSQINHMAAGKALEQIEKVEVKSWWPVDITE